MTNHEYGPHSSSGEVLPLPKRTKLTDAYRTNEFQREWAKAIAAERERCAKIAMDAYGVPKDSHDAYAYGGFDAGREIASKIREGK